MALTDWDTYSAGGGQVDYNVDVLTPLVQTASLQIFAQDGGFGNMVVTDSSGRTKGVSAGRLRTILRLDGPYTGVSASNYCGILAMQSHEDMGTTGSDCYMWGWRFTGNGATSQWFTLRKFTNTNNSLGTLLSEVSIVSPYAIGSVITLEFEWVEAFATLGGVILRGRSGTMTDYSDLTEQVAYFDNSSPLTTTVAEGLGAKASTIGSSDQIYTLDTTELDVLV